MKCKNLQNYQTYTFHSQLLHFKDTFFISKKDGISRNTLYFYYLQKANLLEIIGTNFKNKKLLNKPDKIYLENINLYNILCSDKNNGKMRESFFISQVKIYHELKHSNIGDFKVDDKYLFEIGGKNKSFKQVKDEKNSYVVEIGFGNKIPLWVFGVWFFVLNDI